MGSDLKKKRKNQQKFQRGVLSKTLLYKVKNISPEFVNLNTRNPKTCANLMNYTFSNLSQSKRAPWRSKKWNPQAVCSVGRCPRVSRSIDRVKSSHRYYERSRKTSLTAIARNGSEMYVINHNREAITPTTHFHRVKNRLCSCVTRYLIAGLLEGASTGTWKCKIFRQAWDTPQECELACSLTRSAAVLLKRGNWKMNPYK